MPNEQRQGLVKRQTLTETELADIEQLTDICNNDEGLHTRLSWLRTRPRGNETNDFLYYEDDTLVGYLNVSSYGSQEKELTGMVHPAYRHRGIFRALLTAAKEECLRRGVQKLILICEFASRSGQAFVAAIGAHHEFSEHEMFLATFQARHSFDQRLLMRKADAHDTEALTSIMATDLDDIEEAKQYVAEKLLQHNQPFYLGVLDEEPIGCLRLDEMDGEVGIYGFVVRPGYRGRGYGRQMLEAVIRKIQAESQKGIMLEVDTENTIAIGLYRSCGFQVKTTYHYYDLDVQNR